MNDADAIRIVEASVADAPAVAGLHARSWRTAYRGALSDAYLDGPIEAERLEVWQGRLQRPAANQFVALAWQDAQPTGFVCAFGGEDATWGTFIDNLHVAQAAQGAGIGRRLMQEAARWSLRRFPDCGMYLWVLASNAPAQGFYQRIGGQPVGTGLWQPPDGTELPKLRYAWHDLSALAGLT